MIAKKKKIMMTLLNGSVMLIPADDPNDPNKNYYNSSTGSVTYDPLEQAFIRVGSGIAYSAQNGKDGTSSKMFVADSDMRITYSVDYKNVGTVYGLRFFVNGIRITDIHGTEDGEWHTYSYTFDILKDQYVQVFYYGSIYWKKQELVKN